MRHICKVCPNCGKRLKLTIDSWNMLTYFFCPFCGTHLKKVSRVWGGIVGNELVCIDDND